MFFKIIIFSIAVYISFNFDLLWQARKNGSYCCNLNKYPKAWLLIRDHAGHGEFLQSGRRQAKAVFQTFQVKAEGLLCQGRAPSSPPSPAPPARSIPGTEQVGQHHTGGCFYLGKPWPPELLFPKVTVGDGLDKSMSELGPAQGSDVHRNI